jgi:hypothetical protein
MLKSLYERARQGAAAKPPAPPIRAARAAATTAITRDNPATATFHSRTRLNKPGSEKETWHIEIDLKGTAIDYTVGDSFGLFPTNDPALVDAVIKALDAPADFPIGGRSFREVLIDGVSLSPAPDMLFQLFSYLTGGARRQKAKALAAGEDPDGDAATLDVLAAIEKFPGLRPDPEAFIEALDPLQPRLYSVASSPKTNPGRVALTVDTVRYRVGKRERLGVASTFLGARIKPNTPLRCYVQKAHALRVARRSQYADRHDRPRHRRRTIPRLPARADGHQSEGPQLAVLRSPALGLRLLLRGRVRRHEGEGRAHAPVARMVTRRRAEVLRAGPHARSRARSVGVARGRRACLCVRRRQANGEGCRARAGRHRGAARRAHRRSGDRVRGGLKKQGRYQQDVY